MRGGPWRALTGRLALISLQARCRWRPAATTNRNRGWHGICVCVRGRPHFFHISDRSEERSSVQGFPTSIRRRARVGRPEPSERVVCKPIPSHPIQSRPDHAHHFFRESSLPPSCVAVGPTCRQGQRRPLTRRPWARRRRVVVGATMQSNPFFPCARTQRTHARQPRVVLLHTHGPGH